MIIEVFIPVSQWQGFKDAVMAHYFESDDPVLTRHRQDFDAEYEYASFSSDVCDDVRFVRQLVINHDGGFVD